MAYGFQVKNDNNHVLVDDSLFHYHFQGKYSHYATARVPDLLYGPGDKPYGPNDHKHMEDMPAAGIVYKFSVPSNGTKPPMCFIKAGRSGVYAPFCGIILTNRVGSNWDVWVFQNITEDYFGAIAAPVLYCFSSLDQFNPSTTETHGLVTYNSSGQRTFDSRVKPLRIVGGGNISAPNAAHTGSAGSGRTPNLYVNATSTSAAFTWQPDPNDLIFYCPSLAHACHQYTWEGSDRGTQGYTAYAWSRADLWWCFYRAGFRIFSTSSIECNYGVYASGHVYDHVYDTTNILVGIILGALTGGLYFAIALGALVALGTFTNSGVASGGYLPYQNSSRNTGATSFLISRASYYD